MVLARDVREPRPRRAATARQPARRRAIGLRRNSQAAGGAQRRLRRVQEMRADQVARHRDGDTLEDEPDRRADAHRGIGRVAEHALVRMIGDRTGLPSSPIRIVCRPSPVQITIVCMPGAATATAAEIRRRNEAEDRQDDDQSAQPVMDGLHYARSPAGSQAVRAPRPHRETSGNERPCLNEACHLVNDFIYVV